MTLRAAFFRDDGRLRAGWRVAAFIAYVAVAELVLGSIVSLVAPMPSRNEGVSATVQSLALLAATWVALVTLEGNGRGWGFVWLDRAAARARLVTAGGLLGGLAILVPSLALLAVGWMRVTHQPGGSWPIALGSALALFVPAALLEELLMRGYLLAVLREAWGGIAAVGVTSIAFGLMHWRNPGATTQSLALVTLAGVFLGAVVLVFRSLYAAWAAHFAWNFVMAALLHAPVSGMAEPAPDYRMVDAGPDWATGGTWGPEGGAAGMIGMFGGMTYLFARRRRRGER